MSLLHIIAAFSIPVIGCKVKENHRIFCLIDMRKPLKFPSGALPLVEAPPRFELGNKGFADLRLTTWLWRRCPAPGLMSAESSPLFPFPVSRPPAQKPAFGRRRRNPGAEASGIRSMPETERKAFRRWSGRRDSDSRPQPWQGCALPTELLPQVVPWAGIEPATRRFSVCCSTD